MVADSAVSECRGDATIYSFKGGGIGCWEGTSMVAGGHQRENTRELPPCHLSRLCKAAVSSCTYILVVAHSLKKYLVCLRAQQTWIVKSKSFSRLKYLDGRAIFHPAVSFLLPFSPFSLSPPSPLLPLPSLPPHPHPPLPPFTDHSTSPMPFSLIRSEAACCP